MNALRKYGQMQKETASPERLMVMLFEAALRHMRTAERALVEKRPGEAVKPLTQASDIVMELHSTLDTARAPELCATLGSVYSFVAARLTLASLNKDVKLVREAERAFLPLVEAFQQAVQQPGVAVRSAL